MGRVGPPPGRGHVDDDPRRPGPVAQQGLDRLHGADQPVGRRGVLEPHVQDRVRTGGDRGVGGRVGHDPGTGLVRHGRFLVKVVRIAGDRHGAGRLEVGRDRLGGLDPRHRVRRRPAVAVLAPGRDRRRSVDPVAAGSPARPRADRHRRPSRAAAAAGAIAGRDLAGERLGPASGGVVPVRREIGEQRHLLALVVDASGDQQDRAVAPGRAARLVQAREDHDLDRALEVLERGDGHRLLALRDDRPDPGDDAADHDALAVERLVLEVARVGVHVAADLLGDLAHRVLREVQAEQLLLPAQPLAHRDLRGRRQRPLEDVRVAGAQVEQRGLAGDPVALGRLRRADRVVEARAGAAPDVRTPACAPTLMSASSTFRFASRRSMRVQKSVSERNGPPSARAAMIDSIAPWPTFLTASSPNRIASPSTVNSRWLAWTSGGSTSMPIRRHSATAAATFSSLARNAVSTAVM